MKTFVFFVVSLVTFFFSAEGFCQLGNHYLPTQPMAPVMRSPFGCKFCGRGPMFHDYNCPLANKWGGKKEADAATSLNEGERVNLARSRDTSLETLAWMLKNDPSKTVREEVARTLGKFPGRESLPILREAMEGEPTSPIRTEVERSIFQGEVERLQNGIVLEKLESLDNLLNSGRSSLELQKIFLEQFQSSPHTEVRKKAGSCLWWLSLRIKAEGKNPLTIIQAFKKATKDDPSATIRGMAQRAVNRLDPPPPSTI